MELDEYRAKISDFAEWLRKEFVTAGCGDPKADGCMSCEAVLAIQSLDAMVRVMAPATAAAREPPAPEAR
jgi:hypothetical protein